MKKTKGLFFICVLVSLSVLADEEKDESFSRQLNSIRECIRISIDNSTKLVVAKEEVVLAARRLKNSRRDFFPKLALSYEEVEGSTTGEDFEGEGVKAELSLPLYTSGMVSAKLKQAWLNVEAAKLKHDQILADIISETEKSVYVLLEAAERVIYDDEYLNLCQTAFEVAEKRFKQNLLRDVDWLEIKLILKEAEHKKKQSADDKKLAELSLRQLLNDFSLEFAVAEPAASEPFFDQDKLVEEAMVNRTDLKLNTIMKEIKNLELKASEAKNKLSVSFDSYFGQRAENFVSESLDDESEYYLGLTATLPLLGNTLETELIDQDTVPSAGQTTSTEFTSYKVKLNLLDSKADTDILTQRIEFHKASEEFEKTNKAVRFDVTKKYLEALSSWKKYQYALEKKDIYEKKSEFMRLKMEKNEASVLEYLNELGQQNSVILSLIKAKYNYQNSLSDLAKAVGFKIFLKSEGEYDSEKMANESEFADDRNIVTYLFSKTGVNEKAILKQP